MSRTMVMPSNNSGRIVKWLAARYPGAIGHLYSPGGQRGPYSGIPYALDNGCFGDWDPARFVRLIEWASNRVTKPLWVAVPDVLEDPDETSARWRHWAPWIKERADIPLAYVLQGGDGPGNRMKPGAVERLHPAPDVLFVGGSRRWKWETARHWCTNYPRVHVGRVNSPERLWDLAEWGAESCDGTGWLRGDRTQLRGLVEFLRGNVPDRFRTLFDASRQHDAQPLR